MRYARIDTQADEASPTTPSTSKQFDLLNLLVDELKEIGAQDVRLTDYGAVLATIPATVERKTPTVAFLAHVDTAPQFSGTGCQADRSSQLRRQQHRPAGRSERRAVAGGVALSRGEDRRRYRHRQRHDAPRRGRQGRRRHRDDDGPPPPGEPRASRTARSGSAFTPDEEIGRGVHANLPGDLKADFAYTLDGAELGEIVYETFSADKAVVHIQGVSIHPGQAKDKLVNALHLAAKIIDTLAARHPARPRRPTAARDSSTSIR